MVLQIDPNGKRKSRVFFYRFHAFVRGGVSGSTINWGKRFFLPLLAAFGGGGAFGAEYYVAPNGDDAGAGTFAAPWKTIQRAADALSPGDTAYVRAGTYSERVKVQRSGTASGGYVALRNYPGETPIVSGAALTPPAGESALLTIEDQRYVIVQGFEIAHYRIDDADALPMGVYINNTGDHIQLLDNAVHHIEQGDEAAGGAHGIAAYGRDGASALSNLVISGNTVYACKLGSSESVVLNGNVDGFTISGNTVRDCDNIGIDLIGWEGTATTNDQARNGTVSGNAVYNITSYGNPAYGAERSAGGVYVDGGRDIVIERNRVYACDIGVEIGCEHKDKPVKNVTSRNNLIYRNNVAGLGFGGYDTNRGVISDCEFRHNTFYRNDTTASGTGEVMVQRAHNNVFSDNILVASEQNIFISNYFSATHAYANAFNYNVYYAAAGAGAAKFVWQNAEYEGFAAFQAGSGQDAQSRFDDPDFVAPTANPPDLALQAGSSAIGAGDPAFVPAPGELDFAGNPRVIGGRNDCGAYEFVQPEYLVAFQAGTGGTLTGETSQTVPSGGDCSPVTAVAAAGYRFCRWSQNATLYAVDNPLTVSDVTDDMALLAEFQEKRLQHSADYNPVDWRIDIFELLRVVTLFNNGLYYRIDPTGPDGFGPSSVATAFAPGARHSADYNPPDGQIDVFELSRVAALFNNGLFYRVDATSPDGFAPSAAAP